MTFLPRDLASTSLTPAFLELLLDEHQTLVQPRLERLWDYYRNEPDSHSDSQGLSPASLAQARGLPARLLRPQSPGSSTREIVIENDIAWRLHTLVDFMFSKPIGVQSLAADPSLAALITSFLGEVFQANGGIAFFHDLALLGSVYGYVDVLLRVGPAPAFSITTTQGGVSGADPAGASQHTSIKRQLAELAQSLVLEIIEPPCAVPVLDPGDYRRIDAYVVHQRQYLNEAGEASFLSQLTGSLLARQWPQRRASMQCTEVWTPEVALRFEGSPSRRRLTQDTANVLGRVPVVHIQNLPQPFFYEGLSEVEPLIPLQDELNIRLSDRANRVTFQCFKMYLGKGIDRFTDRVVGPGQMWATDNTEASIQEFGGDEASPSEQSHINEIREALDKTSGVTAIAAGIIRDRLGNLTSENALRIPLMGLLTKTQRKRVTYGLGIERMCELLLHAASVLGVLDTHAEDRRVRIDWPSLLPENESQRLRDAQIKLELGVPREQVLQELGYASAAANSPALLD